MVRAGLACVLASAVALAGGEAGAQSREAPGKYKVQPLNLHREKLGSAGLGEVARTRMKGGDCAGAMEIFEAAIRTSGDPGLRRDRGLCHEGLGHPYPAIDDYRAYLTAQPEATDSDAIRLRLGNLEQSTLGYSSMSADVPGDVEGGLSATSSTGSGSAKASLSATARPGAAGSMDYVEREDDPLQAALRRGKGWSLAPFLSLHKWGASPGNIALATGLDSSFGDSGTWSESVNLQLRYALSPSGAVFAEAGYEHFNSTAVDRAVVYGLTSQIGYELRYPLDAEYDNQVIVAPGLGYQHLTVNPTAAQISSMSVAAFVPRVRLGLRHLMASSAALDVSLDGGVANFFAYSKFPFDSRNPTTYLVGLNVALVWGL